MIDISKQRPAATITITHDLVTETMLPLIRKSVNELLADKFTQITFDFVNVELLDSAGIGMLIAAHELLKKHNGQLSIINISNDIFQMLKIMRLDSRLNLTCK